MIIARVLVPTTSWGMSVTVPVVVVPVGAIVAGVGFEEEARGGGVAAG